MNSIFLPSVNASLNFLSLLLLVIGYVFIKKGHKQAHKITMVLALLSSSAFLTCYLIYHYTAGSVPYPFWDWTRPVYFGILIPHVILAVVMVPFIVTLVYYAIVKNWPMHVKWAKRVLPVWIYVSLTGVLVYLMLYRPWLIN